MTAGNWVAIAALFVTVVFTLLVSYQQRKQMRQIEAFRVDPAVGLKPPLHPFVRFSKNYGASIWVLTCGLLFLWPEYYDRFKPVTRETVVNIVIGINSVILGVVLTVGQYFFGKLPGKK